MSCIGSVDCHKFCGLMQADVYRVPQPLQGKQSLLMVHHVLRNPRRSRIQDQLLPEETVPGAGTKVGSCVRMIWCTTSYTHSVHLIGHRTRYQSLVEATAPRCSAVLMQGQVALSAATALIVPGNPAWSVVPTFLEPRVI